MPDLTEQIRSLSPGALRIYKQKLLALPEEERRKSFSRLSGIEELADIVGTTQAQISRQVEEPQRPTQARPQGDMPLWQKGLQTVSAPFNWISRNITEPFAAVATAPFTPGLPGGRKPDESALGYARRQYEQWQEPVLFTAGGYKFRPTKGIVESLPWLALPSAGAVAGKLGTLGKTAGAIGTAARVGEKIVKPLATVEAIPGKVIGKAVGKVLPKKGTLADLQLDALNEQVAKLGGKIEKAGSNFLAVKKDGSFKSFKNADSAAEFITGEKPFKPATSLKSPLPPIISEAFPEGMPEDYAGAARRMAELIKKQKPLARETLELRKPGHGARQARYEEQIQDLAEQGILTEDAERFARSALKGAYPTASTARLESLREQLAKDTPILFKTIADANLAPGKEGFSRLHAFEAIYDVFDGKVLSTYKIEALEEIFGAEVARALMGKQTWGQKALRNLMDLLNAPRALLASFDLSGVGRQGVILAARRPMTAMRAWTPMLQAMMSEKNSLIIDDIIRTRKSLVPGVDMQKAIESGLNILSLPSKVSAPLQKREESFVSGFVNRIWGIRGSARAYTTVLNDLRSGNFIGTVDSWGKAGVKYIDNKALALMTPDELALARKAGTIFADSDLQDLAKLINWASGRGDLPAILAHHQGFLTTMLFSPKLIFSRLEFPFAVFPGVTNSALVRREAWKQIGAFLGTGAGILSMAIATKQGTVELDPRSTDFGKLKVKDTRLDIWGGYAQYMRVLAQTVTAQGKTTAGRLSPKDRGEVIARFAQSKLSPAAGLFMDILKGQTFLGEEFTIETAKNPKSLLGQVYQRTFPLAIQDIVDGFFADGLHGAMINVAGVYGVGIATYYDTVAKAKDQAAKEKYGMNWEDVGKNVGRATQLELQQTSPKILKAEQEKEQRMATGKPTLMQRFQKEGERVEETYRREVSLAVKEFQATGNGVAFQERIKQAKSTRREMYASRERAKEYIDIKTYHDQPLTSQQLAQMNSLDVARHDFMRVMFAPDMYDEFGRYRFDEAEKKEQEFLRKYGQEALNYIENYSGAAWVDKPVELKMLEQAQGVLEPYWRIADEIWSLYPSELKMISEQIEILSRTDERKAKMYLYRYPQILRARELIARRKKLMRTMNPQIKQVYGLFYGQ